MGLFIGGYLTAFSTTWLIYSLNYIDYAVTLTLTLTECNATTNHCTVKAPSSRTQQCVRQPCCRKSGKLYLHGLSG